jgi:hypothetical protein
MFKTKGFKLVLYFNKPQSHKELIKLLKRNKFMRPEYSLTMNSDVSELPEKGEEFDYRLDSKRTYTKWFNPMTFDPRTPDYFETVRSDWKEDVTRESFGEGNFYHINFLIFYNE